MKQTQRIVKNTVVLALTEVITKLFLLILTIFIARYLGVIEYGKYSFAFAFVSLFAIIPDLGLDVLTMREVARDRTKAGKYLGNLLYIKTLLSGLTFLLIFTAINLMDYPEETKFIVYILGLYVLLTSISNIFRAIFNAFERMEYQGLTLVSEKFLIVLLGLAVLLAGYGLIELVYVFLLASIFNLLFSYLIIIKRFDRPRFEIDFTFWRYLIKNALPFGLSMFFVAIYFKIDTVMLSMMKGDAAVGWYNAAYNLVINLGFIPTALMTAMFPVMSKFFESSKESLKKSYEKSTEYILILSIPITLGIALLSDKIIPSLYGEGFTESIVALQLLIFTFFFMSANIGFGVVLGSINRQHIIAKVAGVGALLNIVLNLILIPEFSYIGASIATVVTEVLVFLLTFYYISNSFYKLNFLRITVKPVFSVLFMCAFILIFKQMNLIILILSSSVLYLSILYLIGGLSKEDKDMLKEVILRQ